MYLSSLYHTGKTGSLATCGYQDTIKQYSRHHCTKNVLQPCTDYKSMFSRNNKPFLKIPGLESPNHDMKHIASCKVGLGLALTWKFQDTIYQHKERTVGPFLMSEAKLPCPLLNVSNNTMALGYLVQI